MNELHLFAGAGGGILGGMLLGHTCVCAVEINAYCRKSLFQRQRDGVLPRFPIWDDVTTFDGKPWRGIAEAICGGFPCTDISSAGKGAGIDGEASGLWSEFVRIIREVGPRIVFVENSPLLTTRGIERVLGDLAEMGFDAQWGVLGAADFIWRDGNPIADHERHRIWILAVSNTQGERWGEAWELRRDESSEWVRRIRQTLSDSDLSHGERGGILGGAKEKHPDDGRNTWWQAEPGICGVADGVADRVDRLKAIGNGQVPGVAAFAWNLLKP